MATTAPIVPQSLPFDMYSTGGSDYYQAPMNNPNDIPVLNSGQYGLNIAYHANNAAVPTMAANQTQTASRPPKRMGKRPRSPNEDEANAGNATTADEEGQKKRSRGRPRLDTKDETAADRRRTQIRLAQRAYRHRKDTAITTLEKRVRELERANDDMSKEFGDFYDLLLSERVLDAAPHALQRFSAIATRIIATADKAKRSTGEHSSDSDESDERPLSGSEYHHSLQPTQSMTPPTAATSANNGFHPDASQQANFIATSTAGPLMPGTTVATTSAPTPGPLIHVPTSLNYEVVTTPTPDNANFPFYSSMEPTAADHFTGNMASGHSPYSSIAPPMSYSSHELTFGRRLQRQSVENGLRLILMSSPPPDRFAAVFGFCLFFESKDAIIKRLKLSLSRNRHEDLNIWSVPFTNLGGAGTYFPPQPSTEGPQGVPHAMAIGNQGTQSYGKPQEITGQSMGPFRPDAQATRDDRIDRKMQMLWPGFEGEFFDPDEIESYLRHLGIFIPQRAEYVEADVNLSDLDLDTSSARTGGSPVSAANKQQPGFANNDSGYGGSNHSGAWTSNSDSPLSAIADSSGPPVTNHMAQQPMMAVGGPHHGTTPHDEYNNGLVSFMLPPGANSMWQDPMAWPAKSKIALNVTVLINQLSGNSVCLGRTPGVRRKDVNLAIKIAAGLAAPPS